MTAVRPGESWDGYTRAVTTDTKPVDSEFAALWPEGTPGVDAAAPGHEIHPKTTVVYDPPKPGQKKRKKRKVPQP
jgi:hypothetical protein